jgi:radical SAM protein with 4Fe4S-binding SPASM domain
LPSTHFSVSTTLSVRRANLIEDLLSAGFDSIGVWPDGFSDETYSAIRRGGDYHLVKRNLCSLLESRRALQKEHIDVHVGMVRYPQTASHEEAFCEEFSFVTKYPNTRLVKVDSHDWAGQVPADQVLTSASRFRWKLRRPCRMPFTTMVVNATGEVSLCCFDMNLQLGIGNATSGSSLRDIWVSERATTIRVGMKRLEPPEMCKKCHNFYFDVSPHNLIKRLGGGGSQLEQFR